MRQIGMRLLGTGLLVSTLTVQLPKAAWAAFTPPVGGGHGATVSGVVVDPPRNDPQQKKGEVVSSTNPNSLWILAGAGIALAILVNGSASDPTTPLGDCADLFDDLFNDRNAAGTAAGDCAGRRGAAMLGTTLVTAAFTLPDPGAEMPSLEARLAQSLLPTATPESAVTNMYETGQATLARLGQPAGSRVQVDLDDYLMPGKTYQTRFTVQYTPGMDLSQPLYLVAADLAQAGTFGEELGLPFAVPVDRDVLKQQGSWTYTTPYTAETGAYFIDAYVSTELPRMLKSDPVVVPMVIDRVAAKLQKAEKALSAASARQQNARQAERDALQAKYLWLLEWSRSAQ